MTQPVRTITAAYDLNQKLSEAQIVNMWVDKAVATGWTRSTITVLARGDLPRDGGEGSFGERLWNVGRVQVKDESLVLKVWTSGWNGYIEAFGAELES